MPTTFQITDGTLTVDLTTNVDWKLSANYLQVFAEPTGDGTIPPDITESIPVDIATVDDDDFASSLQDLAQLARRAAEYTAGNHQDPVWWYTQMQDETNSTRTLVKSLRFTADARRGGAYDRPPCMEPGRRSGVITLTHHPYHERTSAVAASGTANVSVLGGAVNYTDVAGDVSARLYYLRFYGVPNQQFRQFWAGFRSDRRAEGDAGNVVTLWECEDGTNGTDTAPAADAAASPGAGNTIQQCDFTTTVTWARRVYIYMSDVTANYEEQTGAYVVLLRAQVDGNSADVRLHVQSASSVVYQQNQPVSVADTNYTFYNLGTVEWPFRNLHSSPLGAPFADSYDSHSSLEIWARVTPGSAGVPTLDMDCLVLIPCDEYFLHVKHADLAGAGNTYELYIQAAPEDTHGALTIDATNSWIRTGSPTSVIGAGVPEGDGRMFYCVTIDDDGTAPTFNSDMDIQVSYFPRYVHFRGND